MPFLHIPLSYLFICSFDINRYCCFSDVFMKQTMYGWDHEVYLELGQNGENCLKWGANANKMTKSISLSNIEDLQIIDTNGMYNSYDFSTYCEFESRSWRGVLYTALVIRCVSDLRQVGGFLWVLRFPPPIKLIAKV
jgi:hypothetical protein